MQNLQKVLIEILKNDTTYFSDDRLLKNKLTEDAFKLEPKLIKYILSDNRLKKHFFVDIDGVLVFDKDKFIQFVNDKQFLPDSYTSFKNTIGLLDENGDYFKEKKGVVLAWPYKDCVLEGGQDKEDQKRDEIFYNEILAPDEIDRLFDPKVLTNFRRYDGNGEHPNPEISRDDNLIIKGNNLLALHSLKKRYRGKVKLIYIDPPYNIGSDSFGYNDRFNHSTWLTFMKNRLKIAGDLLSDDGAIFVQIDYHEVAYLNVLLNEIFGRDNFVQLISVKTASPAGFKTVNPGPIDVTEYVLFYTKNKTKFKFRKGYVPITYDDNYDLVIEDINESPKNWKLTPLRNIIYELNGIKIGNTPQQSAKNAKEKWGEFWKTIRHNLMGEYALNNAEKVVSIRDPHKPTDKLKELLKKSKIERDTIFIYQKSNDDEVNGTGYVINGGALSFYSNKVKTIEGKLTATELLTDFWADISWDGIAKEGGVKLKNGKKPEKLIKRLVEIATNDPNDIIMDFYLGSGTTAGVVHKMGRRYVGIEQLDYRENDTVVRLNNVINGDQSGISKAVGWKGGGSFVYAELKKWNQAYIDEIESAKTAKRLLAIYKKMKTEAFFRYDVNLSKFEEKEFEKLEMDQQKKVLIECLDKNHLYVNLSEMNDATYEISEEDKEMNRKFYGL